MLAVFKTGGKQYSVKAGQILKVEKLKGNKGDSISFKDVLAVSDSSKSTIGSPLVEGARIEAKILDQIRNKKIIVFKKRRRQNYRSTQGHRQYLTVLQIQSISLGKKKSETSKKTLDKKPSQKKTKMETSSAKKAAPKKTTIKKKNINKVVKKTTKKKEVK
ncbi:MAG: 50S ribosomal protein L21 [Alphaproteobacteria bacterium MarineAlpha5_Bin5]|nr:MAG: 50S ribosomal protein L21 [Alphaproteobacteria bacterium MarineAlpha5_Bin5]PPR52813.1 MAG: 50S ribosomal protein L21 [Alphaproteobacteria bacterium MarineAlpha5_Bin4]|tara:strand:+ start:11213 stop:11695 length:483 start_codon:yes stop_codon:yes gene_type:complete